MEDQNEKRGKVVVVMVPLPLQGHLNQLLHLSHLITTYGIHVHFAGYSTHNHQAKIRLHGWDPIITLTNIHFHDFQLSDNHESESDPLFPKYSHPTLEACMLLRQPVSHLIHQLSEKFKRVIVIHDVLVTSVVQDVKLISNAEAYTFRTSSAFFCFLNLWESLLDKDKPFQLDSTDIPQNMPTQQLCLTSETLDFVSYQIQCLGFESGWLYNTSRVIDGKYVNLMEKLTSTKRNYIKHFAIGPFHPLDIKTELPNSRHPCLEWLDEQENDSVIYVAFGSITSLTKKQIEELANALERCVVKFIWVLIKADPSTFAEPVDVPELPEGYENRIKSKGMVVRDWAPQLEILAHSSIGGFISHCGWNSCIESISMGVPIAAWPMHSDQPKNAILVTQALRIGVLVRDWEDGDELVRSTTIENAVKTLMTAKEGKEMQKRAKELREAVRGSVAEGGSSCLERDSFIAHISREC